MNIESVRARFYKKARRTLQQRVFICLDTYTAHCHTNGPDLSPHQCKKESKLIQQKLAPVARLARIVGVTAEGERPPFTQARELAAAFHEAGVLTVIEARCLLLDMDRIVRAAGVPWVSTKANYEVALCPDDNNDVWGRRCLSSADVGPITAGLNIQVRALGLSDEEVVSKLGHAARALMAEVFGNAWSLPC